MIVSFPCLFCLIRLIFEAVAVESLRFKYVSGNEKSGRTVVDRWGLLLNIICSKGCAGPVRLEKTVKPGQGPLWGFA
ncbi:hypothetical protein BDV23DRAFT_162040 [Aspergillus alliaceus]|uniref:Secreted protein n=1 Tax=Petromyces alliaceus TaxID=209559 RepID=A0A5N7BZ02_PETAA|nr:hypothetical protein BDV23DRAFT_162040 [Aspergillus alliaceus]